MLKTVANLKQQTIVEKIGKVVDAYPYHPYRQAFTNPELRQELIGYVLNRIPCIDSPTNKEYKFPSDYWEQQIQLAKLIHQGIYYILEARPEWVSDHLQDMEQCDLDASHWFG